MTTGIDEMQLAEPFEVGGFGGYVLTGPTRRLARFAPHSPSPAWSLALLELIEQGWSVLAVGQGFWYLTKPR